MSLNGPHRVSGVMHDLPGDPDAALYLLGAAALFRRSELTLNGVGNDFKTRRALELLRASHYIPGSCGACPRWGRN